jgi:hypothetical protein
VVRRLSCVFLREESCRIATEWECASRRNRWACNRMGVALAREKTASERVQCELTRIAKRVMRWMGTLGKGGKNGKNVKEQGGGEGCDGSRSIGETGRWCATGLECALRRIFKCEFCEFSEFGERECASVRTTKCSQPNGRKTAREGVQCGKNPNAVGRILMLWEES